MQRVLPACLFIVLFSMPAVAQKEATRRPSTPVTTEQGKPVTMTGCLTGGPTSYTLSDVATTRGAHETADAIIATSGESTSYMLTPRDGVELSTHVGKKVEITGVLLAAAGTPAAKRAGSDEPQAKPDQRPGATLQGSTRATANPAAAKYPSVAVASVRLVSPTCR